MFSFFKNNLRKKTFTALSSVILSVSVPTVSVHSLNQIGMPNKKSSQIENNRSWKKFHSVQGNCAILLPESPEHVKQVMQFPEEGYDLRYDVYISPDKSEAVYMMLIAQYPPFINQSHAEMSLESFLNGLVTQNHDNNLIFADLIDVEGGKALDFFIESKGVCFSGRAIMAKNNLYLLAMECDMKNYEENNFYQFINSFELTK